MIYGRTNKYLKDGISTCDAHSDSFNLERMMFMGTVDKVFDNFEMLYDNYMDMPEAQEARNNAFKYIEENGIDMTQMEHYITAIISEYERQGFLYGFRYAVSLFLDGTLRYD